VFSWRGSLLDGPDGDEQLERAGELARGLPLTPAVVSARQLAAMGRLFRGEVAEAVRRIESLRVAVERSGTVRDLAGVLVSVAGVYGRAGRCADALAAGRYCVRLYVDVETTPGPGLLGRTGVARGFRGGSRRDRREGGGGRRTGRGVRVRRPAAPRRGPARAGPRRVSAHRRDRGAARRRRPVEPRGAEVRGPPVP